MHFTKKNRNYHSQKLFILPDILICLQVGVIPAWPMVGALSSVPATVSCRVISWGRPFLDVSPLNPEHLQVAGQWLGTTLPAANLPRELLTPSVLSRLLSHSQKLAVLASSDSSPDALFSLAPRHLRSLLTPQQILYSCQCRRNHL